MWKLEKIWPETQQYTGQKYCPYNHRVILQLWIFSTDTFGFGLIGAVISTIVFALTDIERYRILNPVAGVLGIVFAAVSINAYAKRSNGCVCRPWYLSYPCRDIEFLEQRLLLVQAWKKEHKPLLDDFRKLEPIIVEELGYNFKIYGSNDLKKFCVVCDLYDEGDSRMYYCTKENYDTLVLGIIDARRRLKWEQKDCEDDRRAIEEFKASLEEK